MLLFVYGTLKKAYGNHGVITGAEFVSDYTLKDNYYMVDLGPFPAAIKTENKQGTIVGELYRITDDILRRTDRLEGYPDFYNRSLVYTEYGDAYIYHFNEKESSNNPIVVDWHPKYRHA